MRRLLLRLFHHNLICLFFIQPLFFPYNLIIPQQVFNSKNIALLNFHFPFRRPEASPRLPTCLQTDSITCVNGDRSTNCCGDDLQVDLGLSESLIEGFFFYCLV
jgi:hypothetical protein